MCSFYSLYHSRREGVCITAGGNILASENFCFRLLARMCPLAVMHRG